MNIIFVHFTVIDNFVVFDNYLGEDHLDSSGEHKSTDSEDDEHDDILDKLNVFV